MSEVKDEGKYFLNVPKAILTAGRFVYDNFGPCMKRGLPVVGLAIFLNFALLAFPYNLTLIGQAAETILYSIFAVSWHRYTLLPAERARKGFALEFGLREIKFIGVSVGTMLFAVALAYGLITLLPKGLAFTLIFVVMVVIYMTVLFMYPAIALDQPLQLGLFLRKGVALVISYVIAALMVLLILIVPMVILYFAISSISNLNDNLMALTIGIAVVNTFLSLLLIAIGVSTASFLFRDLIGLKGETTAA